MNTWPAQFAFVVLWCIGAYSLAGRDSLLTFIMGVGAGASLVMGLCYALRLLAESEKGS